MKKFLLTILACLPSLFMHAQSDPDFMRSTGKIYVVVAVIVAVFIGLVFFLLYLDRRLTKLENQTKD